MLKKLLSLISIEELKNTGRRFPVSVLCSVFLFVLGFVEINNLWNLPNEIAQDLFVTLIAGFFLSGAVHLMGEARGVERIKTIGIAVLALAIMGGLIFTTDRGQEERFFIFILSTIALVLVAPFIKQKNDDLSFWCFARQVAFGAAISFIAAVILFGGAAGALASIGYLFEMKIHHDIYSTLWLFGATLVAPLYALSFVPTQFETKEQECHLPPQVGFIANWILAPLVAVYIAILYAYFIKIGVTWDIPKNQLANMIAGFAFAGIATYMLAWPCVKEGKANALLAGLMKYLFPLLLIPVLVMVYAIMIRVFDYGMTEKRYIVVVSALWLLFLFGGFIAKKLQLKHIMLSFAVLLFLSVVGPWGMTPVSQASQFNRLEEALLKNNILQSGVIKKASDDISKKEISNISSKLRYLRKTKYYDDILQWYSEEDREKIRLKTPYEGKTHPSALTEIMGFKFYISRNSPTHKKTIQDFERFSIHRTTEWDNSLSIRGYDYFFRNIIVNYRKGSKGVKRSFSSKDPSVPDIHFLLKDDGQLVITLEGRQPIAFDLETISKQNHLKADDSLIEEIVKGNTTISLVFKSISGRIVYDRYRVERVSFDLLLDL